MNFADVEDIDPESLLLIIQLQQDDADVLIQEAQRDEQEAAKLLKGDLDAWKELASEHVRLVREEEPAPPEEPAGEKPIRTIEHGMTRLVVGDDTAERDESDAENYDEADAGNGNEANQPKGQARRYLRRCISCMGRVPEQQTVRFPCSHIYCNDCVTGLHQAATNDESLFPPRCCGQEIPFDLVRPLWSEEEIEVFEKKAVEFRTKDKTYCWQPTCSKFIPPEDIDGDVARCGECKSKTCRMCKKARHEGDCPDDAVTQEVLLMAAKMGWRRCNECKSVVELTHGCNHITCRCGSHFCYECGVSWKKCSCEQWDEARLLAQARVVADRGARGDALANGRQRAAAVAAARQNLVENHNCIHERWTRRNGRHRCEECRFTLPNYIFECDQCDLMACWRCRLNRL